MSRLSSDLEEKQVVCPHCWHGFYADQAMYITQHRELQNDPVLGGGYYRRYAPHEVQKTREGVVVDPKGWPMTDRACPRCHLQIPPDLLERRPFFLSVVGAPRSGKTYLITSMLHGLRQELPRSFGFTLEDSDSHEVDTFLKYEQALFYPKDTAELTQLKKTWEAGTLYNRVMLGDAEVQLPKPFIFTLRATETNPDTAKFGYIFRRNIVLYDNAGESFDFNKEQDGRNRVTQHLARADAVLMVHDPLQESTLRMRLASTSADPQLGKAAATSRQEMVLSETVNRIRRHRNLAGHVKIDAPLVVCVQKFDVWQSLLPHARRRDATGAPLNLIDHSSIEYRSDLRIGALDIEEINAISLLVRAFLNDVSPHFVATAEANFCLVRYFPVSALGRSPVYREDAKASALSDMLWVRADELQPFRVTHPLLWLFQRWRLIHRVHPPTSRSQDCPHAKVEAIGHDRLRVLSPVSEGVLVLDRDYGGCRLFDPLSGKPFWVPQAPAVLGDAANSTQTNVPLPESPAAPPAEVASKPPILKMPPSPPRRGWFKRGG